MARTSNSVPACNVHAEIIAGIMRDFPEAKTKSFMKALRGIPDGEYIASMYRDHRDWWRLCNCVPDAYLIDTTAREVVVFEAVHRHDVDQHKFGKFAELAWALDEDCYDLVLMRCDRFSRTRYLPRLASVVHAIENHQRDPKRDIVYVEDWHRYTAEYCEPKMPAMLR